MRSVLPIAISVLFFIQCSSQRNNPLPAKDWYPLYSVETGTPVSVGMSAYKTTMLADGKDEARIRVAVTDSAGKEIRNASTPIRIYIDGDATVSGTIGSSPLKYVPDGDTSGFWMASLSDGIFSFILRAGTNPDKIKLEVKADSLWPSSHEIHTIDPGFQYFKPQKSQLRKTRKQINPMLGADISFLPQMEERGTKFIVNGQETDAVRALAENGLNCIRLRIFVNPENERGYSPGKGFCGLDFTKQMALRAREAGMQILLNFHYSDYWADPQQQNKPLAWQNLEFGQLRDKVKQYTKEVLLELEEQGTLPEMVQIGNEINHGMLWPDGHISNPDQLSELLKAGVEAVNEVNSNIIIMMHIALGGQNAESVFWLDNMIARGVDFDIIGLSYYPRWHGTLDDLQGNLLDLITRYNKPINIVEYSQYVEELHEIVFSLPDDMGKGTCNWEPLRSMFGKDGVANHNLFIYKDISAKHYIKNSK
ncbi:MAG: glycosyl hydrolase 53 family protein [Bacteroidales bacterium]|jgi:beta-galactosidase|nr:glycosyl hydrolase 53 family protein [Bacteroidales bacterium]